MKAPRIISPDLIEFYTQSYYRLPLKVGIKYKNNDFTVKTSGSDHQNPELNPYCFKCMLILSRPSFEVVKEGRIYQTGISPDL